MAVRSRDLRKPLSERTLEELDYLLHEPGHLHAQRYGWRSIALELMRRLKEEKSANDA